MLQLRINPPLVELVLDDPQRRNPLGREMLTAIEEALRNIETTPDIVVVLMRGMGGAFSAGFDLAEVVAEGDGSSKLMAEFIERLSRITRRIRRLEAVVVVAVDGPALAGGCAIAVAGDFLLVCPEARLGYPVHAIGVSPAVTLPLLRTRMGDGAARELVLSGDILDGREAYRVGLATHLAADPASLQTRWMELVDSLSSKGPGALRATKSWLNRLDGSLEEVDFDATARASAELCNQVEMVDMLRAFWSRKMKREKA